MKVEKYLLKTGIQPHLKGFYFLADAIRLVIKDTTYLKEITKRLYPTIAEKHNETSSKVERAMRYAITTGHFNCTTAQFVGNHAIEIKTQRKAI